MPLPFDWIAGEWVDDVPAEPVGVRPMTDVMVNGEPPGGVVIINVVDRTADAGVGGVMGGPKLLLELVDVVVVVVL